MSKTALKRQHELPTQEQLASGIYVEQPLTAQPGAPKRMRRLDSDALDAALFAGHLTMDQHCTLEAFRQQLYRAGLVFCPRAGTEVAGTSGQGQFISDNAFSRARRVGAQMKALTQALSSSDVDILLSILTMDTPVTNDHHGILATAVEALDKLADRE